MFTTPESLLSRSRGPVLLVFLALAGCVELNREAMELKAQAHYELGLVRLGERRYQEAQLALKEALALNPAEAAYANALGFAYYQDGKLLLAVEAFQAAVRTTSDFADAYNGLGVALADLGRWEEAVSAYQKALALPGYADPATARQNLAWAYVNLGRLDAAREELGTALRLSPNLVSAHYHLGLVYQRLGQRPEAIRTFRRVIELAPDSEFARGARQHLQALGEAP